MSIDLQFRLIVAVLLALGIAFRTGLDTLFGIQLVRYPRSIPMALVRGVAWCIGVTILLWQMAGIPILPIHFTTELSEITTRSIGAILFVIGFVGFTWARWVRGSTWAYMGQEMREFTNHAMITTGPYKLDRHPAYVAQVIGAVGLQLALGSWLVLLSLAIFWIFRRAAQQEQQDLLQEYGDEYHAYLQRTHTLLCLK